MGLEGDGPPSEQLGQHRGLRCVYEAQPEERSGGTRFSYDRCSPKRGRRDNETAEIDDRCLLTGTVSFFIESHSLKMCIRSVKNGEGGISRKHNLVAN